MKTNIYPHHWELLACMLTYKVSDGACLDYERLGKQDYQKIYESLHVVSVESLQKWFSGRKPAATALDDLCRHTSDMFPYLSWMDLAEAEVHLEIMGTCPDWKTYEKLRAAEDHSTEFRRLLRIKQWAYARVLELAKGGLHLRKNLKLNNYATTIKEFSGTYSFFMPGQIPPEKYKAVYVNTLIVDESGFASMQNGYNKKEYTGSVTLKDTSTLQVILHDQKDGSIEYVIFMKIDKYGATAIYFPAVVLGYNGQGIISSYPVLLTTDKDLNIDSPFVKLYLEECYNLFAANSSKGRMDCINPAILQSIYVRAGMGQ